MILTENFPEPLLLASKVFSTAGEQNQEVDLAHSCSVFAYVFFGLNEFVEAVFFAVIVYHRYLGAVVNHAVARKRLD